MGLKLADMFGAGLAGREAGTEQRKRRTLADYMMPATRGDQNALAQVYSADPNAGMQAEKLGRQSQEDDLGNMVKAANVFLQTKDPQAYSYIRERTIKMRPELAGMPEALTTPEDQAGAEKFMQAFVGAYGGGESGNDLRSLRIGEDGNYYGIRGADLVNTGVRAAPNNRIVEGAGGFYGVNTSSLSARPINVGGGQPQTPQGDYGPSETDNYVRSILGKAGDIDPNMPPEHLAEALLPHLIQQESGGNPNAISPKGARGLTQVMPATGRDPGFGVVPIRDNSPQENVRFGRDYLTAMLRRYPGRPDLALAAYNSGPGAADKLTQGRQGQQLQGKPKEVSPLELRRVQLAEESAARAREAAERSRFGNAPAGFRFRQDGSLEAIPGGPKPAGAAASEDERKAAGWYMQANKAFDDMESAIGEDPAADDPGILETYVPVDEIANRTRSPARQRYAQASGAFSEAVLRAATGAGVNKEEAAQKIRELTPQRGDTDDVKTQKRASLLNYLQALQSRAGRALPQGQAPATQTGPRRLKFNPATGKLE